MCIKVLHSEQLLLLNIHQYVVKIPHVGLLINRIVLVQLLIVALEP